MILHVDLDAFFANVEQRDNPKLRGKPLVVGGPHPSRGVVATASYEARKFGIHSGMPLFLAKKLCPHAIFVRGDFRKYEEASDKFVGICSSYSPTLEQVSLDEVYMDLSGTELLYEPFDVAKKIQNRVIREIGITCSVGISAQKTLAKIASGFRKPNGITEVEAGKEKEFLAPLPLKKMPGCGPKTEEILRYLNITRIRDLAKMNPEHVRLLLGVHGVGLWKVAVGKDCSRVNPPQVAKSTSRSTTFPYDTNNLEFIESMLFYLAQRVARDLRIMGLGGRCVSVTIRTSDFETVSMQCMMPQAIATAHELFTEGRKLLSQLWDGYVKLRLVGVGISQFIQLYSKGGWAFSPKSQIQLISAIGGPASGWESGEKWKTLEVAMDKIRNKHGFLSIAPASLMKLKGVYPSNHRGFKLSTLSLTR